MSEVSGTDWNTLCPKMSTLQNVITETLQKRPHSFSLLYHSYPTECPITPPSHTRLLMFSNKTESLMLRSHLRHFSSIDVVMAPSMHSKQIQGVFNTSQNMGLSLTTVFIFLQPGDREATPKSLFVANLPALYFYNYNYAVLL